MKKVLISGGTGAFATQIKKFNTEYDVIAPSSQEMNLTSYEDVEKYVSTYKPDIFLHAGAYTRPMKKHEQNPDISIKTNIIGTSNVVLACMKYNIKLVYISTDYVYPGTAGPYSEADTLKPFNKYGWSKLGGECAVRLYDNSLILRLSMCEKPFAHPKAFVDVKKSMIYNDSASKIVLKLLEQNGTINIGGPAQTVYNFVKELNPNVGKIYLKDICDVNLAKDTSLDIGKMKRILSEQ